MRINGTKRIFVIERLATRKVLRAGIENGASKQQCPDIPWMAALLRIRATWHYHRNEWRWELLHRQSNTICNAYKWSGWHTAGTTGMCGFKPKPSPKCWGSFAYWTTFPPAFLPFLSSTGSSSPRNELETNVGRWRYHCCNLPYSWFHSCQPKPGWESFVKDRRKTAPRILGRKNCHALVMNINCELTHSHHVWHSVVNGLFC